MRNVQLLNEKNIKLHDDGKQKIGISVTVKIKLVPQMCLSHQKTHLLRIEITFRLSDIFSRNFDKSDKFFFGINLFLLNDIDVFMSWDKSSRYKYMRRIQRNINNSLIGFQINSTNVSQ